MESGGIVSSICTGQWGHHKNAHIAGARAAVEPQYCICIRQGAPAERRSPSAAASTFVLLSYFSFKLLLYFVLSVHKNPSKPAVTVPITLISFAYTALLFTHVNM